MLHTLNSINMLPIDVESVLVKVFGYFCVYTVRVERVKETSDRGDQEYCNLLEYGHAR